MALLFGLLKYNNFFICILNFCTKFGNGKNCVNSDGNSADFETDQWPARSALKILSLFIIFSCCLMLAPIHKVSWVKTIWKKPEQRFQNTIDATSYIFFSLLFGFLLPTNNTNLSKWIEKEKQFDFENENSADGAVSGPSAQRVLSNRLPAND